MRKIILYGFLILSLLTIGILYFLEDLKIPVIFDLNPEILNKLLETIAFAYITSFIFYLIVVVLKDKEDKNKVYKILEEPLTVFINELCSVYKTMNPEPDSISVEELLLVQIPKVISQQKQLYSNSNGTRIHKGTIQQISWIEWLKKINDRFLEDTNDLFTKYSFFLDTETGLLYEKLKISDYTRLINSSCLVKINSLEQLEINSKFKTHHQSFYKIFKTVFKGKKTEIRIVNDRFSLRIEPRFKILE